MAQQTDDGFGPTSSRSEPGREPVLGELRSGRLRRGDDSGGDGDGVMGMIREIPNFVKLLGRLATDPRVSAVDKGIMLATVAYIASPIDLIPDFIVGLGQLDDRYLLALALNRLLNNAGEEVLLDHWDGDPANLDRAISMLDKAGAMLPEPVRRMLGSRMK